MTSCGGRLSGERGSSQTLEYNVKSLGEASALSDVIKVYEFEMGDHHSLCLNRSLFFNHVCMIGFDDDCLGLNCLNLL